MSSVEPGAGRKTKEDKIDHKAGIIFKIKIGDKVRKGDIIAELFSDSKTGISYAKERIDNSIIIRPQKSTRIKLIKKVVL